jgi:hypothetical protein
VAVILEIVQPDGARTFQRLESLPLTVGRGLGNDVILDDPYVDARHARIALDDNGALRIEDLGSVNGLVMHEARVRSAIALQVGAEVRLGRTTLRFRDSEEAVAPALVDEHAGRVPVRDNGVHVPAAASAPAWTASANNRLALILLGIVAVALTTWLGSTERSSASAAFGAVAAYMTMVGLWAGVWAGASRANVHRFSYQAHFAIASAVALAALAWTTAEEWLDFFFPDAGLIEVLSTVIVVALIAALIAGHLSLSSTMPRKRRWVWGSVVAVGGITIGGLAALAATETFTDIPTFSGVLKPVTPSLIPTTTVSEFGEAMAELKKEVDEMAAETARKGDSTTAKKGDSSAADSADAR